MRTLVFYLSFLVSNLFAETAIYVSSDFVLHLKEDASFLFYPKEQSLKTNVAGNYLLKNDSLILTTHHVNNEQAIFAIYSLNKLQLELLHFQKEFALSLPNHFDLSKTLFANQKTRTEYRWEDIEQGNYSTYKFSEEGYLLAIENFKGGELNGRQLYYFNNPYSALEKELNYKEGLLHGSAYYFEAIDEYYLKVKQIKKEDYKEGRLVKTKTPVAPLVFYTSHF